MRTHIPNTSPYGQYFPFPDPLTLASHLEEQIRTESIQIEYHQKQFNDKQQSLAQHQHELDVLFGFKRWKYERLLS